MMPHPGSRSAAAVRIGRWGLPAILAVSTVIMIASGLQHRGSFFMGIALTLANVLVQGILELNERLLLERSQWGIVVQPLIGIIAFILVIALGVWDVSVILGG